jgi:uncharacterized protein (TIGR02246 family)
MRTLSLLSLTLGALFIACAPQAPPVDLEAARKAIRDADAAWSTTADDPAGFAAMFTETANFFPPDSPMISGPNNIKEFVTKLLEMPGFSVSWKASGADVASSGDLGYSHGTYAMTMNSPEGKPMNIQGKYVTVWKKQASGEWKVVADIFNPNGPPTPSPE